MMSEDRTETRNKLLTILKDNLSEDLYETVANLIDVLEDKAYTDGQYNIYETMEG